ncbi:recombinase family protein [Sphingobium sp. PNB]|uniref:recombinase family protein n=1 Tax=Sphingobium sp. PNB TaxID=863934 RepID=UPI001CA468B3|nr:recombinase family protein [Sphingobium sp. PNB]MCB4859948.1 recombinase family protein [Sphingobium sp. PNB]
MTRKSNQKAVIYCRVSTKKQAREGNGLESQEIRCREYAGYRGHQVVQVFSDDMSGSLSGRPGMLAMLAFLKKHRRENIVVIIDDISRLARGIEAHLKLRADIASAGGLLESPSIEFGEDSDSILVEHLLASVSQHQRQKNGEQAKNRMKARLQGGWWVFNAPIGFRYQRSSGGGSILVRDEPVASIIAEGINGYASGRFNSQAEVKRFFESHPEFPVCRHGFLTNEQVNRILTRPIYASYIESKEWGVSLRKAQHEAIISLETFEKVQERLSGKSIAPARKDVHLDFAMRGFIACGECHHPMTSNYSTGRHGKRFPYYVCRRRGCEKHGKSAPRAKVEGAFEEMLRRLVPSQELFSLLSSLFRKRWDEAEAKVKETRAAMKLEITEIEKKVAHFLDRIVESDSATVIGAYERKVDELERKKLVMIEKTSRCGTVARGYDETFRTAFEFLGNPWKLWESGSFEDRRIVQKLVLASHLEYDWSEGVRTPEISLPFKVLGRLNDREKVMAETEGFEPSVAP